MVLIGVARDRCFELDDSERLYYLQEPLTGMFPDKGMLVLGSIELHALLSLKSSAV